MKTPGQRQLITLQEQVKLGIVNVDEAVLHFKEWQLNQKRRSESFRFQQVTGSAWTLLRVGLSPRRYEKGQVHGCAVHCCGCTPGAGPENACLSAAVSHCILSFVTCCL